MFGKYSYSLSHDLTTPESVAMECLRNQSTEYQGSTDNSEPGAMLLAP